jgi:signal peptidase I
MFFFTPKHVQKARLYQQEAQRLLSYRRDIVSENTVQEVETAIAELAQRIQQGDQAPMEAAMQNLDDVCRKLAPPIRDGGWRENVETFVVAISIALGVRTFFVQPFTIPTGSMQPTLNGIITRTGNTPAPSFLTRVVDWVVLGRDYFDIVATRSETILDLEERHYLGIQSNLLRFLTYSVVRTDQGTYTANVPVTSLRKDDRCARGRRVNPGDVIARGHTDTGDHVLVDKCSVHFVPPRRADVFVFNTVNIPTHENVQNPGGPSQYYIKRLAGMGGDTLRIDPPALYRDGKIASEAPFQRVMSGEITSPPDGYRGYSNGPEHGRFGILGSPTATYSVPPHSYFALGDNSFHSSDSRDWGPVPEQNVIGRGWLVYWPFNTHWGRVR